MKEENNAMETVKSYLSNLDSHNFEAAGEYLGSKIKIVGPAGEGFRNTKEFLEMMKIQQGKYEIKKSFAEGNDVAIFYNFKNEKATAFMASWYTVNDGKIVSIKTIFDPSLFQ